MTERTTSSVVQDMLSRISGPYAICMDYHPEMPIRGTLIKYGNEGSVNEYAKAMRSCYLEKGFSMFADRIVVFTATEDEIVRAIECTGSVASIYEGKLKKAEIANNAVLIS